MPPWWHILSFVVREISAVGVDFVRLVPPLDQQVPVRTLVLEKDHVVRDVRSPLQPQRPLVFIDRKTVQDPATVTATSTAEM